MGVTLSETNPEGLIWRETGMVVARRAFVSEGAYPNTLSLIVPALHSEGSRQDFPSVPKIRL